MVFHISNSNVSVMHMFMKGKVMATHRGTESTYQKISERFFWHGMIDDVKYYIKTCRNCQQQGKIPNEVMKQISVDLCNLPEVDGITHLIVCIDYFSKWSEAKAVKDKSTPTVASLLYEIICRYGYVKNRSMISEKSS